MDYFDILLAKKLSGGGGGEITVEGLSVEDNGTYTAPSGKAYSPVVVNLPLGEKAITANGEYNASADDLKGFSKVTVNVAGFTKKAMPTGAISTFNDGTANPLTKLKIAINPVQAGSGDPSPSNPRAISGWTGANVDVCGINLCDEEYEEGRINITNGQNTNASGYRTKNYVKAAPNTKFYIKSENTIYFVEYDAQKNFLRYYGNKQNGVVTTGSDTKYVRFYCTTGTLEDMQKSSFNYPSTDTSYHAYNGSTVPISWQTEAGTVYGGELDVTSGILKARPYYASYNGEPLVEPWISSLDKYVEGTTPTTGAQVVDLGGTETTYQLTPTQISSILGTNNIWADCGDVLEGEYFASL